VERLLGLLVVAAVVAAVVGIPVFLIWGKRAFDRNAAASLESIYRSAERQARAFGADTPTVSFRYHTYSGLLLYVTQSEHRFALPARVAEGTLHDLLMHTMKFGFFAYGAALIPVLAYLNYLAQRRSIRKQAASFPRRVASRAAVR
jgi:hypothetical protein